MSVSALMPVTPPAAWPTASGRATHKGDAAPVSARFGCGPLGGGPASSDRVGPTAQHAPDEAPSLLRRLFLAPINAYQWVTQNTVYRWLGNRGMDVCLYRKNGMFSCSEYTKLAIREYGVLKGIWAGTRRIFSCNPLQGWLVEKHGKRPYDPLQVHGSYAQARVSAPDFLNHTRRGRFFAENIGPDGMPRSIVRPEAS